METLDAFDRRFPTEDSCREYLRDSRCPDGVKCPRCGNPSPCKLKTRPFHWLCKYCKNYRFSVISGTIFENTKKPLKLWFRIAYFNRTVFGEDSTSDYHTTWYMCTRLRAAMRNQTWDKLMGQVEVDETAIGGKDKNRHWDKKQHITGMSGKTTVIGAISRKGNVVCQVIENTDALTLSRFVRKAVSGSVDLVATDEHAATRT